MAWTRIAANPFLSKVKKFINKKILRRKKGPGNRRQDKSLPMLKRLLAKGYNKVQWDSGASGCPKCRSMHRKTWDLNQFISETTYAAGIFCRTHPGDESCSLIVTGPKMQKVRVDSYGNVDPE